MSLKKPSLRIATRKSKLALWQAQFVQTLLQTHYPELNTSLYPLLTKGDKLLDSPLAKIGGKGLFIKELELAIEEGNADIAVHSMKDVGIELPQGFVIAAILPRASAHDVLVSPRYQQFEALPSGAIVGTCSLRRKMQLAAVRPDLVYQDLRGNLDTRLKKLDENQYDAIVLAQAGLSRLSYDARIAQVLPIEWCLPAIGQGAIGIECREDSPFYPMLKALNHEESAICVQAERVINARFEGSCQVPMAAYATIDNDTLSLRARIGTTDGKTILEASACGAVSAYQAVAEEVVEALIAQGAWSVLAAATLEGK